MTEPNAVTAWVVSAIVGVAALVTKLDPSAVIGAFAGSVTFALTAKDTTLWARAIYMIVSLVVATPRWRTWPRCRPLNRRC